MNGQNQAPCGGLWFDLTAQMVIKWFKDLGIPICEDLGKIKPVAKDAESRYLKMTGSPTPTDVVEGRQWFRISTEVEQRLPAVIDLVYEYYSNLADPATEGFRDSGGKTVSLEFVGGLAGLAKRQCLAADGLARKFATRYITDQGWREGGPLDEPAVIEGFNAEYRNGAINVSWKLPSERCDRVVVARREESGATTIVYEGKGSSFEDTGVAPGTWYTYQGRVFYRGAKGPPAAKRVACLGDVTDFSVEIKGGKASIIWKLPSSGISVWVFRRDGQRPAIRKAKRGLQPAGPDTLCVHQGAATSCEDTDLIEGARYRYLIVSDYGQGLYTDGVEARANVPVAPPSVAAVTPRLSHDAAKVVVSVIWPPVRGGIPADYVLLRSKGDAAPARMEDGQKLYEGQGHQFVDKSITVGCRYTYSVFTRLGDQVSHTGTASKPIDVVADVGNLVATPGDGTVHLSWKEPTNVKEVIIRRRKNAKPEDINDGARISPLGPGQAKDDSVENGKLYWYGVYCVYQPAGAGLIYSEGKFESAAPDKLPTPVQDFKVKAAGREAVCTWQSPQYGKVVLVRSAERHSMPLGARIDVKHLARIGEPIAAGQDRAIDPHPDLTRPYYSVFTVAGNTAIVGQCIECAVVPDVTGLQISRTKDGAKLTWEWQAGCDSVIVVRCAGAWPDGPGDPNAVRKSYTRTEYRQAGARFIDRINTDEEVRLHYTVYAQDSSGNKLFFSRGAEKGCKAALLWCKYMTLRVRWSQSHGTRSKPGSIYLWWHVTDPIPNFSGFVLLACRTVGPESLERDLVLYRWKPEQPVEPGAYDEWVSLGPVRRKGWAFFFCKAVVFDPSERPSTMVIQSNTCVPVLETGEVVIPGLNIDVKGYEHRVPEVVVCPTCLTEFSIDDILYAPPGGGDPVRAKRSLLDRLRGKPPSPPVDKSGRPFLQKLCPERHKLPFTAGTQPSLIIGLIGAKSSGKSSYIASLIHRLGARTAADMQGDLLPVGNDTLDRYHKVYYTPLFKERTELVSQAGKVPPLIYNLSLNGILWRETEDRSVDLALYDTAGENLQNADQARQMVDYLSVAKGLIFLVDPLQVPEVCEAMPSNITLPDPSIAAAPEAILRNVFEILDKSAAVVANKPFSIPVAMVLTKCDALHDAGIIGTDRVWSTDRRNMGFFDTELHEDMAGMMGEYMYRWAPAAYRTICQRFPRHAFFGVSATGCSSESTSRPDDKRCYRFVSPWRVEDPLLWLLAELKVLPTR